MKKLLFLFPLFIAATSMAQVDNAVDQRINGKLDSLSNSFISVSGYTKSFSTSSAGTFACDTFTAPVNGARIYWFKITSYARLTNDAGKGILSVTVANNNSTYFVRDPNSQPSALLAYKGSGVLLGSAINAIQNKAGIIIAVTSGTAAPITWTLTPIIDPLQ